MRILKIKGKNEQVILEQIKKEYGSEAMIISTHFEHVKGFFGFLKKPTCIVTIAIEEESSVEDLETKGMFTYLKDQIDYIKKDIEKVKDLTENSQGAQIPIHHELPRKETIRPVLYNIMKEKLCGEGIQEEVIEKIVEGLEEEENLENVAREMYTHMNQIMPHANQDEELPQIIFFIGSTGVGKTTTIAKLTAEYVINRQKKVALMTADTYRIAAIEQLKTYAEILNVPLEVIYSEKDLCVQINKWKEMDHIFIDTAGRSHKNIEQMIEIEQLLKAVSAKKVYLVLNVNTNYKDVKRIVDQYKNLVDSFNLIITKLDETDEIGNLMNIVSYANSPITYITNGQNVPDDIKPFDCDEYIKALLGRISYE